MTKPLPIIIDTDPGQDDAVAILLALASPEFEVLGITAVAGNVPLALTEKNSRKICELAGKPETKVFAGAIRPMIRPLVTAEEVHGKTGLDGPVLPEPEMPLQGQYAVDFIVETLMSRPAGTVTLCTLVSNLCAGPNKLSTTPSPAPHRSLSSWQFCSPSFKITHPSCAITPNCVIWSIL